MIYHKLIIPLLIAVQFLTTIPVRLPYLPSREQNAVSMLYYPLIGVMIGAVLWSLASFVSLPIMLLSCLVMAVWVWLTGGLHLDGLVDTADAWVGGFGDKERTLTIMKDPNAGAMGVIAIVVNLALKWAAVYSLLELRSLLVLIIIPMLARLSALVLFASTPYVRKQGLGSALTGLGKGKTLLALLLYLPLLVILPWQMAVGLAVVWLGLMAYLRARFMARIGGITGDTVGASIEISEVVLLVVVMWLYY